MERDLNGAINLTVVAIIAIIFEALIFLEKVEFNVLF